MTGKSAKTGVFVTDGVKVIVGVGVSVGVLVIVGVALGEGVKVDVGILVGDGVKVGVASTVTVIDPPWAVAPNSFESGSVRTK